MRRSGTARSPSAALGRRIVGRSTLPALVVGLAMAVATPGSPCSMVASNVYGPYFTGDGWAYWHPMGTGSSYGGAGRLVFFGAEGRFVDEVELDLGLEEGHAWIMRVDSDRSTWWRVRCDDDASPRGALCGRLVKLTAWGDVVLSVPVPPDAWIRAVRGQGFVFAHFGGGELVVRRLDVEKTLESTADEPVLEEVRRVPVPDEWSDDEDGRGGLALSWAMNPKGWVVAMAATQDGVRIRRWDDGDAPLWDRTYERARPGHATPEGKLAIGHPWLFAMAGDGSLVMTGWQYHADCSPDRPPGMLVLGPDGALRAEVAYPYRADGLALDDGDAVAVSAGTTRVFDLDGRERLSFSPASPSVETEKASRQERMASLGPDGPVADWIELYHASGREEEIAGWLSAAWPRVETQLPDALWLELAARLCREHPEAAPARALERFGRATGDVKREWLGALTTCFEGLPEGLGVEAYLQQLESGDDHRGREAARAARVAWIESAGDLEGLWAHALERGDITVEGKALVASWDRTAGQSERRLRSPRPEERYVAQRLLFALLPEAWELRGPEHAELRRSVLAAVEPWLADEDPVVRGTAAVLLLGNTVAEDEPPSAREKELLETVATTAGQRPELAAWAMAGILDRQPVTDSVSSAAMVERDRAALAALPEATLLDLFDALLAAVELDEVPPDFTDGIAPHDPRASRAFSTVERAAAAAPRSRSETLLDRMTARAFAPGASAVSRRLLLVALCAHPSLGGVDRARRILAAPWLLDRAVDPIEYIVRVWRIAGDEPRLRGQAVASFRAYLRTVVRRPDELAQALSATRLSRSPVSELRVEDLRPAIREPEDVREWLSLIAETGAWRDIEADVAKLLDDPHVRLSAARALAFHGEPRTLDILIEDGLGHWDPPVDAFSHYRGARERVEALALHQDDHVRRGAQRVARALGPSAALVEALLAESRDRLAAGLFPDLDALLLLHDEGHPVLSETLGVIAADPDKASWLVDFGRSYPRDLVPVLIDLAEAPDTDATAAAGARLVLEELWAYESDPEAGRYLWRSQEE